MTVVITFATMTAVIIGLWSEGRPPCASDSSVSE